MMKSCFILICFMLFFCNVLGAPRKLTESEKEKRLNEVR